MLKATGQSFYFAMSLVVAAIVVYGFSFTVNDNLIHPAYPRPWILYVHAVVFSTWVSLFIVQTALVRARRVSVHRRVGPWTACLGVLIPILGIATAIAMAKLRAGHGEPDAAGPLPISTFDMVAFTTSFALAIYWRKRPEFHRRLMFMATCALTAAAFGRIPVLDHADWFYVGVDALIAIAVARDLIVDRRVHPAFAYGLPAMIAGQVAIASFRWSPWWIAIAHNLY
jgi:uncharacterized membrane protein YozB (DUF420 family)